MRGKVCAAVLGLVALPALAVDYPGLPALESSQPQGQQLTDIEQCADRLLAVGERGIIIYSDDGGQQWQQAAVPSNQLLTAVSCVSNSRAWAVGHGGVVLASDDHGESWELQFDGDKANQKWLEYTVRREAELRAKVEAQGDAVDPDLEYELEDAVFSIEDAEAAIDTGPADPLLDVWFRDVAYGIAVGAYGMIYRTTDGGENWELLAAGIDNPDRYHYYSLAQAEDGTLYLSGEAGMMFRSATDGETWERLDSGYDGSLFGVLVAADNAVIAFGLRGNILRSVDRGDSWETLVPENNPGVSLYGGGRLAEGEIVLVGTAATILSSTDNGGSFDVQQLPSRSTLSAAVRTADQSLWVVGMDGLELAGEQQQ